MPDEPQIISIAHVIQLAVAPVFLLTGIAAILNTLSNRLGRIVDRARALETEFPHAAPGRAEQLRTSLRRLSKRAQLASWGISLCTASAILVSGVVIILFIGALFGANLRLVIAIVFIAAMLAMMAGLIAFLREVYLSIRYLRIGEPEPEQAPPDVIVVDTDQRS